MIEATMAVLFVLALGSLGGLFWLRRVLRRSDAKREDLRTELRGPSTPIGTLRDGDRVKVVGRVKVVNEALRSPVTGRPCVYYEFCVRSHEQQARLTLVDEKRGRQFLLEDASGRVLVRMVAVHAMVERTPVVDGEQWMDHEDRLAPLLTSRDIALPGRWAWMDVTEAVVEEGETVAVAGIVRPAGEAGPAFRSQSPAWRIEAPPQGKLLLSDEVWACGSVPASEPAQSGPQGVENG